MAPARTKSQRARAAVAAHRRGGPLGAVADRANLADDAAEPDPRRDAGADDPDVPAERAMAEDDDGNRCRSRPRRRKRSSPAEPSAMRAAASAANFHFAQIAPLRRRSGDRHRREPPGCADRRRARARAAC